MEENTGTKQRNPIPTTDIIIESNVKGKPGIVLITRRNEPYGYALPGGYAEFGLTLEKNAEKEALEETNIELKITPENLFCMRSSPLRDPRQHTLSACYTAKSDKIPIGGDDAKTAKVYSIDEVVEIIHKGEMCFDHEFMILDYLKKTNLYTPKDIYKVGLVGRFKPLHNGAKAFLETLCMTAERVIIGIGSSNRELSARNPFTAEESKEMIMRTLKGYDNYSFIDIPDFAHLDEKYRDGQKWKEYVTKNFGCLDYFVTGNNQVAELLSEDYHILNPLDIIPDDKKIDINATTVRMKMARDSDWKKMVPKEVSEYIVEQGLDKRFRERFGCETIEIYSKKEYWKKESLEEERMKTIR